MKLILLGTGTPILDPSRPATSAFLVRAGKQNLLFDTGRGVSMQLLKLGLSPVLIDYIFISHHHYDHIADLGEVIMTAWHNGRDKPIYIYGPKGTEELVNALLGQVFVHDIRFATFMEPEGKTPSELIKVHDIDSDWQLQLDHLKLESFKVNHGQSLGLADWNCLAYKLTSPLCSLVIAGDAAMTEELELSIKGVETLLISCYLAEAELTSKGFIKSAKHIIISSGQVGKLAHNAGIKRLILTHFRKKSAELMVSLIRDVQADFTGELVIAEDLMELDLNQ